MIQQSPMSKYLATVGGGKKRNLQQNETRGGQSSAGSEQFVPIYKS